MDKVAKELVFSPIIRVVIPKDIPNGYSVDEYACNAVEERLNGWTKQEIIDWVIENWECTMDAIEPYDTEYDEN